MPALYPLGGDDGADGLLLDVSGCAHLMGGEPVLLDDLRVRLEDAGLIVRAALAATPAAALALARCGRNGAIVPADGTKVALSGLPVEGLTPPPDTLANLHRLGLRSIGDVLPLLRPRLLPASVWTLASPGSRAGLRRQADQFQTVQANL